MVRVGSLLALMVLAGCPGESPGGGDDDSSVMDDDDTTDEPVGVACAVGMSLVGDPASGDELYCIDTYEVVVEGESGDLDQFADGAQLPDAVAYSRSGEVPTAFISFGQALAICANTPVLNDDGVEVGSKWLATSAQWRDAADGVPGDGGSTYPYGDELDAAVCATPELDGTPVYDELQLTGSMDGCVSAYGVYDQCGNIWEWTDPGLYLDVDGWFDAAELGEFPLESDDDGTLVAGEDAELSRLDLFVSHLPLPELGVDETGALCVVVEPDQIEPGGFPWGYLTLDLAGDNMANADGALPVEIQIPDPPPPCLPLLLLANQDGVPLADKRGGAYYVGDPSWCQVEWAFLDHTHDWSGTIGFRCASEPLPVD
jgi:hypothetical protein